MNYLTAQSQYIKYFITEWEAVIFDNDTFPDVHKSANEPKTEFKKINQYVYQCEMQFIPDPNNKKIKYLLSKIKFKCIFLFLC